MLVFLGRVSIHTNRFLHHKAKNLAIFHSMNLRGDVHLHTTTVSVVHGYDLLVLEERCVVNNHNCNCSCLVTIRGVVGSSCFGSFKLLCITKLLLLNYNKLFSWALFWL